jgi:uncharacterized protein YhbP (UPF0306 family)
LSNTSDLATRSDVLIEGGRFVTLATTDPNGAWASTVAYVPLRDPLRLLWYSLRETRHSRNIENHPIVSGSIWMTGLPVGVGLDGAQFTGTARTVQPGELDAMHAWYYERSFPEESTRREWMLPAAEFHGDGARRFYLLEVREWWLLDVEQWLIDKRDQRIVVPPGMIGARPAESANLPGR